MLLILVFYVDLELLLCARYLSLVLDIASVANTANGTRHKVTKARLTLSWIICRRFLLRVTTNADLRTEH